MNKLSKLNTFTILYAALAVIVGLYAIATAAMSTSSPPKLNETAEPANAVYVDCPCCVRTAPVQEPDCCAAENANAEVLQCPGVAPECPCCERCRAFPCECDEMQ